MCVQVYVCEEVAHEPQNRVRFTTFVIFNKMSPNIKHNSCEGNMFLKVLFLSGVLFYFTNFTHSFENPEIMEQWYQSNLLDTNRDNKYVLLFLKSII